MAGDVARADEPDRAAREGALVEPMRMAERCTGRLGDSLFERGAAAQACRMDGRLRREVLGRNVENRQGVAGRNVSRNRIREPQIRNGREPARRSRSAAAGEPLAPAPSRSMRRASAPSGKYPV